MRTILAALFICSLQAVEAQTPSEVKASEALYRETIPHFELKKVTFKEALASLRQNWELTHPDEFFPIGVTDYGSNQDRIEDDSLRLTLDLKNVPYIEALRYIANLAGRQLTERQGIVQLQELTRIQEDWETKAHRVTPVVLKALGLGKKPTNLKAAFSNLGVEFPEWAKVGISPDESVVYVTSYIPQQEQVAGIILLLKLGFKISK